MSKELPYFKFVATEWLTGNITYESLETQGLFVNICAIYWRKSGILEFSEIELRFKKKALLAKLSGRFFSLNNGFIKIGFLDEQLSDRQQVSKKNSENGSLGGRPSYKEIKANAKPTKSQLKAKKSNIEEEEEEEEEKKEKKERKKSRTFVPPTLEESILFFADNGYNEELAKKAFRHYEIANWHNSHNKKVASWKQTFQTNWFKDEHKTKSLPVKNENLIYYKWQNDPTGIKRTIEKERAERYFANQLEGGYIATILL